MNKEPKEIETIDQMKRRKALVLFMQKPLMFFQPNKDYSDDNSLYCLDSSLISEEAYLEIVDLIIKDLRRK
jgi:hypothetical protein